MARPQRKPAPGKARAPKTTPAKTHPAGATPVKKASASAIGAATAGARRPTRTRQRTTQKSPATPAPTRSRRSDQVATRKGLAHRLYLGEASYDFIGNRKKWYLVSAAILLICLASLIFRGLNLGIEFSGGTTFNVPVSVTDSTINDLGKSVVSTGLPELDGTSVVTLGDHTARVQTRSLNPEEVVKVRAALARDANVTSDKVAYSSVGASWGKQITEKGIQALVVFVALVGLMIWAYFRDWKMSVAALVALIHDLILTVGLYSLLGFTVSPATLIGVLTILGYSLYDTVVVFDKVRENVKNIEKQDHTYAEQTNLAINQVLVRSLNTTLIGVLPVLAILSAALFFMGPGPLEDLGLALFVGMVAGAYSSIFIAAPLLAQLREREPAMREHRARLGRRTERHARGSKVSADVSEEAARANASPEVVVNRVGDNPWELEGVDVDNEAIAAELDEPADTSRVLDEAPTAVRTRRATRPQQRGRRR